MISRNFRLACLAISFWAITQSSTLSYAQDSIKILVPFDGQYVTQKQITVDAEIHSAQVPAKTECWIDDHLVAENSRVKTIGEHEYSVHFKIRLQQGLGGHHLRIRMIDSEGNSESSSNIYFTQAEYDENDNLEF